MNANNVHKPSRWKRLCPTKDELKSLADRPTLSKFEVVELAQGLLPTRNIVTYLSNYKDVARRLLQAFVDGELTDPVRTEDFVRWSINNNVALPEPFVARVLGRIFHLRRPALPSAYTDERIWELSTRGRRKKKMNIAVRGIEADICNRARNLVIVHVKQYGILPRKAQINKKIALQTGRKASDIDRCYNVKTCLTPVEFNAAKRHYRNSLY